jgi:hypothetical protein
VLCLGFAQAGSPAAASPVATSRLKTMTRHVVCPSDIFILSSLLFGYSPGVNSFPPALSVRDVAALNEM